MTLTSEWSKIVSVGNFLSLFVSKGVVFMMLIAKKHRKMSFLVVMVFLFCLLVLGQLWNSTSENTRVEAEDNKLELSSNVMSESKTNLPMARAGEKTIVANPSDKIVTYGELLSTWTGDFGVDSPYEFVSADFKASSGGYIAAGDYTVTVGLKDDSLYEWEIPTGTHTFTLTVLPRSVTPIWNFMNNDALGSGVVKRTEAVYEAKFSESGYTVSVSSTDPIWVTDRNSGDYLLGYCLTAKYRATSEDEWAATSVLHESGYYIISIDQTAVDAKNYSFSNKEILLEIKPQDIDLNNYDNLHWEVSWTEKIRRTTSLRSGDIYIYYENFQEVPYYGMKYENGLPVSGGERRIVEQSFARYRENYGTGTPIASGIPIPMTISILRNNDYYDVYYDTDSAYVRTASEVGIYVARAILTAKNNFSFTTGLATDAKARGLVITISEDGKTATVEKTWYILKLENGMLDEQESIAQKQQVEYSIPSWTYGEDITIDAPRLEHGDEGEIVEGLFTFNLTYIVNGVRHSIGYSFNRKDFNKYINKTMPAGDYELSCVVADVVVGPHVHWWDGADHSKGTDSNVLYRGFSRLLRFTVEEAPLIFTNESEIKGTSFTYLEQKDANGHSIAQFFGTGDTAFIPNVTLVSVNRRSIMGNIWVGKKYDEFYGDAEISFNLYRMRNLNYYTENEFNDVNAGTHISLVGPRTPDTYTVYYQITAPNHRPLVNISDDTTRREHAFTVIIYTEIAVPTLSSVTYDGTAQFPVFDTDENFGLYTYVEPYDCIEAATYQIKVTLRDSIHYKWVDKAYGVKDSYADFEVTQAKNIITYLNIMRWTYGEYNSALNTPIGSARFGEIQFTYDRKLEDGSWEPVPDIAAADAGTYRLFAKVSETDSWAETSNYIEFTIQRVTTTWTEAPNIIRWRYGEFDEAVNVWTAKASSDVAPVFVFYQLDASGNPIGDGVASMTEFRNPLAEGKIPAGDYRMIVTVDETVNYTAHRGVVDFYVLKSLNQWKETPNIMRWTYGEYDAEFNAPTAVPLYGNAEDVVFTFYKTDAAGNKIEATATVGSLDAFRVDGKVPAGKYIMEAHLDEGDNYSGLHSEVTFYVMKASNRWVDTPDIIRWTYGEYDAEFNAPTAIPLYGDISDVVFTFYKTDATGNKIEATATVGSLDAFRVDGKVPAGKYIMEAHLEEDANYSGLHSEVKFDVLKASNVWIDTPNILCWTYGEYNSNAHTISAKAQLGEVHVVITDASGEVWYDSKKNQNLLGEAPAGLYQFTAMVEETENYFEISEEFDFRIFPADGTTLRNYWTTTPNIQGWVEGIPNLPVGEAAKGEVVFTYYRFGEDSSTATRVQPTTAGTYVMLATVSATNDYEGLSSQVVFKISAKPQPILVNEWTKVPQIRDWTVGATASTPVAEAKYGSVEFAYKKKEGTALLTEKPTEAGDYILIVTAIADGCDNLVAEVEFTIHAVDVPEPPEPIIVETPSNNTGLIVTAVVLGVVAAGLGAMCLVLFLRKKKH